MQISKRHIVSMLRDRGVDQAGGLEALLPESVDVERDRRPLELLGIGRGDLLKQYGDDATVLVSRHQAPAPAECGQVGVCNQPPRAHQIGRGSPEGDNDYDQP